jgi:hypothetical protein
MSALYIVIRSGFIARKDEETNRADGGVWGTKIGVKSH